MTRAEIIARRLKRLHAIEDFVLTALYYVAVWTAYMWLIKRCLGLW